MPQPSNCHAPRKNGRHAAGNSGAELRLWLIVIGFSMPRICIHSTSSRPALASFLLFLVFSRFQEFQRLFGLSRRFRSLAVSGHPLLVCFSAKMVKLTSMISDSRAVLRKEIERFWTMGQSTIRLDTKLVS